MPDERLDEERPCLHCMMVELINDFFAEYPATAASDKVNTSEADEVIDAIAKTVAELTSQQDGVVRQQVIEEVDAPNYALRRRVSRRRRPWCKCLSRTALGCRQTGLSVRSERRASLDPAPMLDRPGVICDR